MRLTIITVNYNGAESTLKLLNSLKNQTDPDFEVIVVDNASEEEDFARLKGFEGVKLIRNSQNLGFSEGNNVGIREAFMGGANWVLLINNDSWVDPDYVARLKPILSQKEGILGTPVEEGGHVSFGGHLHWFRTNLHHLHHPIAETKNNAYINGAALAISKDAFQKLGGLDEKYFLYFEDTDYSVRARKKGVKVNFISDPKSHHSVSATTSKLGSPLLLRYHYRNSLYFNWKNGPWYVKILLWPWSFWIMKKQIFKIMFFYNPDQSYAILAGVIDFYKNRMGQVVDF